MARAIAQGAHRSKPGKWDFTFYDIQPRFARSLAKLVNGKASATVEEATNGADLIILAVKPNDQPTVIAQIPPTEATVASIAAGISTVQISQEFEKRGSVPPVVRIMPNVNAMVAMATSALCTNEVASEDNLNAVRELFDAVGTTMVVPERLFSAFTAMAGSSPAFFFQIVEHLARAGVKHGLTKDQATSAACNTMLGSAQLLRNALEEGGNPSDLVDRVCSPGGTTIAGLLAAEALGLGPSLVAAVDATVTRDKELGN